MTAVNNLIIESENPVNNRPQAQTEFGVSKEETGGPFQRFIQRYRQSLGQHVTTVR